MVKACAQRAALGPASLVLYDVSTLYFEIDAGDGLGEPGFSKERRLDPQITIGLLTDAAGFPLTLQAFEGNKAETATMLPVITAFMTTHQLADVVVVADAGMISAANQAGIEDAGQALYRWLTYCADSGIPELIRLATTISSWAHRATALLHHRRYLQRTYRSDQPTDQKDKARRTRIPQFQQLPTSPTTALWR